MYLQVAAYLRDRIESSSLSPGDQLPPETELAQSFHISRHTIREALRYLKARGYIESRQGKGSVVRDRRRSLRVNPVIGSINDLLQFASETVLKPVSVASESASGGLAELLNLEPGGRRAAHKRATLRRERRGLRLHRRLHTHHFCGGSEP